MTFTAGIFKTNKLQILFLLIILTLFFPSITQAQTAPVCDQKAVVSFTDTSTPSIYRSQSLSNQLSVTNPNDPACGSRLYGLSKSYPGGWSIDLPYSVTVSAGSSVNIPFTLTSSSNAAYQTYSYSVYAGDSSGGVLVGAHGSVNVVPRCDVTVQAALLAPTQNTFPGLTVSNQLILTNPNIAECNPKTYIYSRGYPSVLNLTIQPNVTVSSGQTVSVPFDIAVSQNTSVGEYRYDFSVYNSWADGSGQAQVNGVVSILDNAAPLVDITSPQNNTLIQRSQIVTITANASDNVGVTKVEFYINGALTCSDTTSSYSCPFKASPKKGEVYNLEVIAYDSAGNTNSTTSKVTTSK